MTHQEFLVWESASRDTIDVKRCCVDLAQGDLIAGILLSQIVCHHLPAKNGADNKLIVERDGCQWLAKGQTGGRSAALRPSSMTAQQPYWKS